MARRPQTVEVTVAARGAQGLQGPGPDLATLYDSNGAIGDGVADDTLPIQTVTAAVVADGKRARAGAKTYAISSVSPGAGFILETSGKFTKFLQRAGTADNIRLIYPSSYNNIGSLSLEGQIGLNAGEQNHLLFGAVQTGGEDITDLRIGDIWGYNARGDVVYHGVSPAAYTAGKRLSHIRGGMVFGNNTLRNVVSITGGRNIHYESVVAVNGNGFCGFDLETDPGNGPTIGIRVDYIEAERSLVANTSATVFAEAVSWGTVLLSPNLIKRAGAPDGNSDPPYGPYSGASMAGIATQIRNTRSLQIENFLPSDYNAQAIKHIWSSGELDQSFVSIDYMRLGADICKTEAVYRAFVVGAKDHFNLHVGQADLTATLNTSRMFLSCSNIIIDQVRFTGINGGSCALINDCDDATVLNLRQTNAIAASNCIRARFLGGVFNGERFFSFCTRSYVWGMDITASVGWDVSGTNNSAWCCRIGGTFYYVLTAQFNIDASGNIFTEGYLRQRSVTPMGYSNGGPGGTSVQTTSKSNTAPTLNKPSGKITMHNAALAAGASVTFDIGCDKIATTSNIIINVVGGVTSVANYSVRAGVQTGGVMRITLKNESAGSLSEAVELQYSIINGATS